MRPTSEDAPSPVPAAYGGLRRAFDRDGGLTVDGRREALRGLRAALVQNAEAFAAALHADFRGRSRHETLLTEVALLIAAIDHALPRLRGWAKPRKLPLGWPYWPSTVRLIKQPRGVAGLLGPGNYPLQLVLMPLVSALSAGCRVLVKPSERTPATAALIRASLAAAIDPAAVAVVCGDAVVAAEVTSLPLDIILFTGSHRVGRQVLATAASQFTPVVLELGGKSPVIVDRGADLGRAARSMMAGKLVNAGQTCVAPDYVLVPRESQDALVRQLCDAAAALYPKPDGGDYSAILTDEAFARLRRLEAGHATVPLFAGRLDPPYYEPRLVLAPPPDSAIMREEIFGPLLPVIPYDTLDDAVGVIRALPPPLVLYWFGDADAPLARVMQATASGAVSVNETLIHAGIPALPFGGIGASGMGRYHGRAGFDAFTHERPVFRQSRFSVTTMMRPPYGVTADRILARLLR